MAGAAARLRDRPAHPPIVQRAVERRRRFTLSRVAEGPGEWMAESRVDHLGDRPSGPHVSPHRQRHETARNPAARLSADGERHCRDLRRHMTTWFRRVWHLINRPRRERELVREMHDHREAMHDPSAFGDTHRLIEQSRDAWGWNWLDDAVQDLRVGVRTLLRSPSFAITATLILSF